MVYLSTPSGTTHETSGARRPQQERGQRRVDAILDAAAGLISEVGIAGLTVQAIAERAQTSKGSLYHFFADLDGVVRALAERHVAAVGALAAAVRDRSDIDWRSMAATEVVGQIMAPFEAYIDAHPEVPLIMRSPANQQRIAAGGVGSMPIITSLIESVLRIRTPDVAPELLAARASAMVAILHAMKTAQPAGFCTQEGLRTELRRALAAYLEAAERAARSV